MASNKRERELARLKAERQAARRAAAEEARRKRRNTVLSAVAVLAVLGVVIGLGVSLSGSSKKTTLSTAASASPATPSASPTPAGVGACGITTSGTASKPVKGLPNPNPAKKGVKKVVMTTNRGEIDLTLDAAKAPCAAESFAFLAAQKYFDGTSCHRLTSQGIFVLQCGDPTGTGTGGPGYSFTDENLTALGAPGPDGTVTYPRGTVAMANSGPNTNGSQFFLVYKNSPLQPSYTPFGTITKGLAILDAVAKAGSTPPQDGKPKLAVKLLKVTVSS